MTPPPPFGFSRSRDELRFDPALDDEPLATARAAFAQGRWTEARTLLAETGDAWDRRGHRLVVLGEGRASSTWAREWQLAEPGSPDAAALLGCALVFRAVDGKERPETAREACLAAAALAPADPTPWLCLLILARHTGTDDDRMRAFDQVRGRHRDHHHGHQLMAACLAERPQSPADGSQFHEVYEFAEWAAGDAPEGSPLAVLPVVAHAELYRVLAAAGTEPADPAESEHWRGWRARQALKRAFDWWLEWDDRDHPRLYLDLNFLVHAQYLQGRNAEAAALFNRIGGYATRIPWSYPDRDPKKAFRAAREAVLGPGSP
ncbi:hypothetical protein ACIP98_07365 [Streptomyces sp. NPDC088354]|uniref:hypothetical protein n=1 Tax=unclassified Streptomyces TaxID=2593676 RepID=UPI0029B4A305|nr:hypothetical protein [Streptomyces sp. MI02-7b]MDX3071453.1 hypothetical protein [Streptomyces sp. MI02-7b]